MLGFKMSYADACLPEDFSYLDSPTLSPPADAFLGSPKLTHYEARSEGDREARRIYVLKRMFPSLFSVSPFYEIAGLISDQTESFLLRVKKGGRESCLKLVVFEESPNYAGDTPEDYALSQARALEECQAFSILKCYSSGICDASNRRRPIKCIYYDTELCKGGDFRDFMWARWGQVGSRCRVCDPAEINSYAFELL